MKEYHVYLKEVNWYRTTVTAACEADAKDKEEKEWEEGKRIENYETGTPVLHSSLDLLTDTEMAMLCYGNAKNAGARGEARNAELAAARREHEAEGRRAQSRARTQS